MRRSIFASTVLTVLLIIITLGHGYSHVQLVSGQGQTAQQQPPTKRNVYLFLVQFLDAKNETSPERILSKLGQVNSYFNNVTYGAWQFNWTLIYPSLGKPWFTANETYAQAGVYDSTAKLPMVKVVSQAWNATGPFPDISSSCCNNFSNTNIFLIIHAGNDSAFTGNQNDIWSITAGPVYITSTISYDLSFVAENDPVGMMIYEVTHQLEWFTENRQVFGQIGEGFPDPTWGIPPTGMASTTPMDLMFGGGGYPNGPHPSDYGVFDRLTLGFPINVTKVDHGQSTTVSLGSVEQHSSLPQGILVPVKTQILNGNPYNYFYVIELRTGNVSGDGDSYFPWNTGLFPSKTGLLIWYFNYSEVGGGVRGYLVKAHQFDTNARSAMFGPCAQSCTNTALHDATNGIDITILSASNSSFMVEVSNAPAGSLISICPTPNITCFLGFLDVGGWGLVLDVVLAISVGTFAIVLMIKRRRREESPTPILPSKVSG